MKDHATAPEPTALRFEGIWRTQDEHIRSGRIPGYVGAVRIGGHTEVHAAGSLALDPGSAPMTEDTPFRIASLTKLFGGVLLLSVIEDGMLSLDDRADRWLPEFGTPKVLVEPGAQLDEVVDAARPITVRHLATCTMGLGVLMEETPLQRAMIERGLFPGPLSPPMDADGYVASLSELPLAFQPGDGWLYDTPIDLLGVLLSRASGKTVSQLVRERITDPLRLSGTTFWTDRADRLPTAYRPAEGGLEILDPPDGEFSRPPRFEELASGLLSTAPDMLTFLTTLADGGSPVLSKESVAQMSSDSLTPRQRRAAAPILGPGESWGLCTGVTVEPTEPWMSAGQWGWSGGTGTTAAVDPVRGAVGVLLTQRAMSSPDDGFDDFWTSVAEAAEH